jgi:hypothetical protein
MEEMTHTPEGVHPSLWNCAIDWRTSLLLRPRLPANQLISFWPSCMALAMPALNLPRSGLVQQASSSEIQQWLLSIISAVEMLTA